MTSVRSHTHQFQFILLSTNKIMRLSASTSSIYSEPIRFLLPLLSLPKKQNIVTQLSRVLRFCSTLPAAGCGFGTKSSASDTPVETREALRAELVFRPTERDAKPATDSDPCWQIGI